MSNAIAFFAAGAIAALAGVYVAIAGSAGVVNPWPISERVTGLASIDMPADYAPSSSMLARQLSWSLDHQRELWKTDGYRVQRSDGPSIWIANEDYGIAVGPSKSGTSRLDSAEDRLLIWKAYQRWLQWAVPRGPSSAVR